MAASLPSVKIPNNTWIDLYSETGITVGVQLLTQNKGDAEADLIESSTEPTSTNGSTKIQQYEYRVNKTGNIGAWAFSMRGTTLQVEEA